MIESHKVCMAMRNVAHAFCLPEEDFAIGAIAAPGSGKVQKSNGSSDLFRPRITIFEGIGAFLQESWLTVSMP